MKSGYKTGVVKKVLTLFLIFLLSINSFAAIVSDNDGSAFITKAEFDALKSSFQSQIDTYNQSIDSKIDGAISSYLAGIKISNEEYVLFFYDGTSFGDGNVKNVKWTKKTDYALKKADSATKDSQKMKWTQRAKAQYDDYTGMITMVRPGDVVERYVIDDNKYNVGDYIISAWGNYEWEGFLENNYFAPFDTCSNSISNYIHSDFPDPFGKSGRKGNIFQSISVDAMKDATTDKMDEQRTWEQLSYGYETLPTKEGSLSHIKFAPLSTANESVVTDTPTTTAVLNTDYTYKTETRGKDAIAAAGVTVTVGSLPTKNSDYRPAATGYGGGLRIYIDLLVHWFKIIQHNKLKYQKLIEKQSTVTNYPISCGITLTDAFSKDGKFQVKALSSYSGKLIIYTGAHLDSNWGGHKGTYSSDSQWNLQASVPWVWEKDVKKGDYAFVVWLPDTDCALPITDMTLTYES